MVTTATILKENPAPNRWINILFTFDSGRTKRLTRYNILPAAVAQTEADALIPVMDVDEAENDYDQALQDVFQGKDIDVEFDAGAYPTLTRNDMRRKSLRRIANRLENVLPREVDDLANTSTWANSLTNAVVAARLTSATQTWTNNEANTLVKQKLAALVVEIDALSHGKGAADEDIA